MNGLLVKDIGNESALLILRVLETIATPSEATLAQPALEEYRVFLPTPVLDALEQKDQAAFDQTMAALSSEEQQRVLAALQALQELAEKEKPEQGA